MRWLLFEDNLTPQLFPLALARPVFELICGREGLRRRVQRWFPTAEWGALIRPWLVETVQEELPEAKLNRPEAFADSSVLMINGRWMPSQRPDPRAVTSESAGFVGETLAWILLRSDEMQLVDGQDYEPVLTVDQLHFIGT